MVVFVKIFSTLLVASVVCAKNCENHPIIQASTANANNQREDLKHANYGDDVAILCSGGSGQLKINNDVNLKTEIVNETAVQLIVKRPDVGQHEYLCMDVVTQCEDTLRFTVQPSILVTSRKAMVYKESDFIYFVPRGDTYEVFCSANDIQSYSLVLAKKQAKVTQESEVVNKTTLSCKALANDTSDYYYSCKNNKYNAFVIVKIDFTPEAQNFRCVLHESLRFECLWKTSSKMNSAKLWFLHIRDNRQTLLCAHNPGDTTRICSANLNLRDVAVLDLNVRLETCNQVICNNQTFSFNANMILKLDAPSDIKVLNTSSHSAVIAWSTHDILGYKNCVFKVEYRLLATAWLQANTSAYTCLKKDCNFLLNLPCSDMHYEVRVLARYREASEDRFWSDPSASAYFFTDPKNTGAINQVCHVALEEPEPISSVETALNEITKLIRHTIKEKWSLKEKISGLKQKMAQVEALRKFNEV